MHSWVAKSSAQISCAVIAFTLMAAATAAEDPEVFTRPVRVVVTDEDDAPLQGVKIHRSIWSKERFPANADYITNEKGETVFGVPHEVSIFRLWATKEDYVPLFANFDAKKLTGDPVPLEYAFRLVKGATIGGFVRDEAGAPIVGAKVEVCIDSLEGKAGEAVVSRWLAEGDDCRITDERGFWTLSNVPPLGNWKIGLRLRHPDHVDDLEWRGLGVIPPYTFEELRAQTTVVVMETGVKVSGTIKDPAGKPVAGALVVWGDHAYHNSNVQETLTDKEGHYQVPPQAAGSTTLTIVAPGFSPELKAIDLEPPKVTEDFQLRAGQTIVFQFVDAAGKPVPGVAVNIAGWRNMESLFNWRHPNVPYSKIPDKADERGRYEWTWAPEDEVGFYFGKKGYRSSEGLSFGPGTHEFTLYESEKPRN